MLKPLSNKIHYIRFGAGVDRTFNYNPVSVSDTYTFTSELTGTLTWESNDTSVATASDGVVTAVATGRAEIKATDESGNYEIFYVDVV